MYFCISNVLHGIFAKSNYCSKISAQGTACECWSSNCDNALQVTGRGEPHNHALLHPDQDRVMSIRESARIQVHHFLQRGLQQYQKGSESSLETGLPVLRVDRGLFCLRLQ